MGKRKRRPSRATGNKHDSLRHPVTANAKVAQPVAKRSRKKSFKMLLGCICLVAFFLRLLNLLQTFELPTVVQLMGDARGYVDWAQQIASGEWYGTQTFYQAPLYPYMLAVLIKVFSADTFGLRFFQIILGTLSVGLLGLAGRHAFNRQGGGDRCCHVRPCIPRQFITTGSFKKRPWLPFYCACSWPSALTSTGRASKALRLSSPE